MASTKHHRGIWLWQLSIFLLLPTVNAQFLTGDILGNSSILPDISGLEETYQHELIQAVITTSNPELMSTINQQLPADQEKMNKTSHLTISDAWHEITDISPSIIHQGMYYTNGSATVVSEHGYTLTLPKNSKKTNTCGRPAENICGFTYHNSQDITTQHNKMNNKTLDIHSVFHVKSYGNVQSTLNIGHKYEQIEYNWEQAECCKSSEGEKAECIAYTYTCEPTEQTEIIDQLQVNKSKTVLPGSKTGMSSNVVVDQFGSRSVAHFNIPTNITKEIQIEFNEATFNKRILDTKIIHNSSYNKYQIHTVARNLTTKHYINNISEYDDTIAIQLPSANVSCTITQAQLFGTTTKKCNVTYLPRTTIHYSLNKSLYREGEKIELQLNISNSEAELTGQTTVTYGDEKITADEKSKVILKATQKNTIKITYHGDQSSHSSAEKEIQIAIKKGQPFLIYLILLALTVYGTYKIITHYTHKLSQW